MLDLWNSCIIVTALTMRGDDVSLFFMTFLEICPTEVKQNKSTQSSQIQIHSLCSCCCCCYDDDDDDRQDSHTPGDTSETEITAITAC